MALPTSGNIDLLAIQTEFGTSGLATSAVAGIPGTSLVGDDLQPDRSLTDFYGRSAGYNIIVNSFQTNYNLAGAVYYAGWDFVSPVKATITITTGTYICGTAYSIALRTGSFPAGSNITLYNYGTILGSGGDGGNGGYVYAYNNISAGNGGNSGGTCFYVESAITVYNYGTISGGGGGGGGGGAAYCTDAYTFEVLGPGGGGGGGQGGALTGGNESGVGGLGGGTGSGYPNGGRGIGGTIYGSGSGGAGTNYNNGNLAIGGTGGAGGSMGSNGAAGGSGYYFSGFYGVKSAGGAGGSAGYAVAGNSLVTWGATGTRYGTIA
jgi:hypothetical protein